jgi:hypothetical protein
MEDDYLGQMLQQQASIDEDEQDSQNCDATQEEPDNTLLEDSNMYNNPSNVNNLGRTAKWIPSESQQENTNKDGNMFAFVSQADGPMLSAKCKQQIMVLNYILETMPNRKRVLRTSSLVPTFDSDDVLTTLVERVVLSSDEMDLMEGARDDIGSTRVDAIPLDKVCDFRKNYALLGYVEQSVKLGEIVVSPVYAKYTVDGADQTMVYWLVMIKTRRCFDFSGHVSDIVATQVRDSRHLFSMF